MSFVVNIAYRYIACFDGSFNNVLLICRNNSITSPTTCKMSKTYSVPELQRATTAYLPCCNSLYIAQFTEKKISNVLCLCNMQQRYIRDVHYAYKTAFFINYSLHPKIRKHTITYVICTIMLPTEACHSQYPESKMSIWRNWCNISCTNSNILRIVMIRDPPGYDHKTYNPQNL